VLYNFAIKGGFEKNKLWKEISDYEWVLGAQYIKTILYQVGEEGKINIRSSIELHHSLSRTSRVSLYGDFVYHV